MTETEKKLVDAERAVDEAKQAVQDIRKAIESEAAEAAEAKLQEWEAGDCFHDSFTSERYLIVRLGYHSYAAVSTCGSNLSCTHATVSGLMDRGHFSCVGRITFQEWAASRTVKEVW